MKRPYIVCRLALSGVLVGLMEGAVLSQGPVYSIHSLLFPLICYLITGTVLGLAVLLLMDRFNTAPWIQTVATVCSFSFVVLAVKLGIVFEGSVVSSAFPALGFLVLAMGIPGTLGLWVARLFRQERLVFSDTVHFSVVGSVFLLLFGTIEHVVYVNRAPLGLTVVHFFAAGLAMVAGVVLVLIVNRIRYTRDAFRMVSNLGLIVAMLIAVLATGPRIKPELALLHYKNEEETDKHVYASRQDRNQIIQLPPVPKCLTGHQCPNIILIVADTLRKDRVSLYSRDHVATPNIDSLGEDGLVFRNATATAPWTLPSHASLFTGLYSSEHHAHYPIDGMEPLPLTKGAETLAEILKQHGYRTGAVVANSIFLTPYFGMNQGFEFYYCNVLLPSQSIWGNIVYALGYHPVRLLRIGPPNSLPEMLPFILRWVDRCDGRPFFLFLNFMEPHGMIHIPPPKNMVAAHLSPHSPRAGEKKLKDLLGIIERKSNGDRPEKSVQEWYNHEIEWFDLQFGRLLSELKARGLYEDSLILFLSDHGEMLGEHGIYGHNRGGYAELIDIPFIMKYPRGKQVPSYNTQQPVQLVDVMPEILHFLKIEPVARMKRMSGSPFSVGRIYQYSEMYSGARYYNVDGYLCSLKKDAWKLVSSSVLPSKLYHLGRDLGERDDVSGDEVEKVRVLEGKMRNWFDSLEPLEREEPDRSIPKDLIRQMKALGYM